MGTFTEYTGNISWEFSTNIPQTYVYPVGNSASFKYKQKITGETGNNGTKNFEINVPLRTLEILLINSEINLVLTWSTNCFIVAGTN